MKTLLVSESSRIVANVLNEDATILIFKKFPKDYVGWMYLYCMKDNYIKLVHATGGGYYYVDKRIVGTLADNNLNGKVVARFYCDKVEEIRFIDPNGTIGFSCEIGDEDCYFETDTFKSEEEILKLSCLNGDELFWYLAPQDVNKCCGYTIHISNLEIFDKPKELSEFYMCLMGRDNCYMPRCDEYKCPCYKQLVKAPKNYCFIEVEK